jgi:hypothetical protein
MISNYPKSCLVLTAVVFLTIASWGQAAVEITLEKTLQTEAVPIDVTVSTDGQSTFVLTDDGNVVIFDNLGNRKDTIKVGPHINQIEIDPSGERLFATSRQNKTVEIMLLDFISSIDTAGSAFKGPENAPVTIAVFSEFQ